MAPILDLPVDIIHLIFPYLDVTSFNNFTSTCKALHSTDFTYDSTYWASLVRRDFRVPNQPVVQNDGYRWRQLYKRLRTQSKIFTWGNDDKGCLGHTYETPYAILPGRGGRRLMHRRIRNASWPKEMHGTEELGVVSDLQSGGWSNTVLTSKGALYTVGTLDGIQIVPRQGPQASKAVLTPLRFPHGMLQPKDTYDQATAVKQFSAGRSHVLALSDSGRIWSWQNVDHPALHVKFIHHETKEDGRQQGRSVVKKVLAGWNKSAALVEGSGIVLWEPLQFGGDENDVLDAALVLETAAVPQTSYVAPQDGRREDPDDQLAKDIGEVQSFIVLEDTVLFNTSLGKVFAALITWTEESQIVSNPVELHVPRRKDDPEDASFVTDTQGSFRNFAVFTRSGAVLTSDQDRLMPHVRGQSGNVRPLFRRIPALQNKQVISLAFGDYHFHALHSPGYITSYGYEPQNCGALGLGGSAVPESRLRGIRNQGIGGDGLLVPHAYTEGRRVWFEQEKREWLKFLTSGAVDEAEAAGRLRMAIGSPDVNAQGEVSEWIEQESRDWEEKFGIRGDEEDDGLGAYFALNVTAAGWHSGALVLVNEDMAEKLKRAVEVPVEPVEPRAEKTAPQPTEGEAGPSIRPEQPSEDNTPANTSFLDRAADFGRFFLGLDPYNVSSANYDPNAVRLPLNEAITPNTANSQHQNPQPLNYGASPREGYRYVWAQDHFPRLRLSDGTEMPGEVEFDEWRYGRPDWKLDWENEDLESEDEH